MNGTNGMNGTNTGTNGNTPTQSIVSAQVSRLAQGTYTLAVNQFGQCGDSAGAAPGPSVLTLGTITVNANGQGGLPTQTINFPPQAFIGRTVSLVAGGGGAVGGPVIGESQIAQSAVQTGIVGCGRFTVANQGNGGGEGRDGLPGTTGTGSGNGTTGTGTGAGQMQPRNPTGTGTTGTGTGTFPKLPGQLPKPTLR